ncbi:MAG: AlpA family phage regulatory protein [Nitrospirales bacterium]
MDTVYISDRANGARFKVSRATIWRWIKTRGFPQPIKFSPGCTRWKLADVEAWEAGVIGTSEAAK